MQRQVVITGSGVVSSLGDQPQALYQALLAGGCGIDRIEGFEVDGLGCDLGGEIKGFRPRDYLGRRNLRALDRTGALVTTAAAMALDDAGWTADLRQQEEVGLVLGTMYCSVGTIAAFDRRAVEAGPAFASAYDFANSVINAAAGQAAIWLGLKGVNSTIACGAASGLRAVAYAAEMIASGRVDVVLAGGAEELCAESFLAFDRTGRLCRSADGDQACAVPLHRDRNGSVLGEGAGLVVLEAAETARARGAQVKAEIKGWGAAFEPDRGHDPERMVRATVRSLRQTIKAGGLEPGDLAGLSLAADGSPEDLLEAESVVRVLGEPVRQVPATAIAAGLGQCLGAGGGLQMVVALESLRQGRLPGVAGLTEVDPQCQLCVDSGASDLEPGALLLNAASFDGHRCSVVLVPSRNGAGG
jgi:3-oxoacyl-[acyl-carrier-protein] synthase II